MRSRRTVDTASGFDLPRSLRILSQMTFRVHAETFLLLSVEWKKASLDHTVYMVLRALATRKSIYVR